MAQTGRLGVVGGGLKVAHTSRLECAAAANPSMSVGGVRDGVGAQGAARGCW